jgi:predicted GNAT family acetyltransferase
LRPGWPGLEYSRLIEATVTVRDNPQASRYELILDGGVVGELVYRQQPKARVFLHTEISDELEGRGLGTQLVEGALDDVRAQGLKVIPLCPFVSEYLRGHTKYAGLVL